MRWSSCFLMQKESLAWEGNRERRGERPKKKIKGKPDLDLDNHVASTPNPLSPQVIVRHHLHCVDQADTYILNSSSLWAVNDRT